MCKGPGGLAHPTGSMSHPPQQAIITFQKRHEPLDQEMPQAVTCSENCGLMTEAEGAWEVIGISLLSLTI